ncbi:MAG TPA: hypothetical protein VNP72_07215, partial [Longimicrobium sp.]|nr:hypothetical protein [Longimicrobium sp.]
MPEYLAPGVYVEETSFRAKSIEGVSTSTTAFVGPTRRGPISGTPELVTSYADFERIYGGLGPVHGGENFLAHGVRAYFNEGGARLYVARVFTPVADANDGRARSAPLAAGGGRFVSRFPGSAGNGRITLRKIYQPATAQTLDRAGEGAFLRTGGANPAAPARISLNRTAPFSVPGGAVLSLMVNGTKKDVTFAGESAEVKGTVKVAPTLKLEGDDLTRTLRVTVNDSTQTLVVEARDWAAGELVAHLNSRLTGALARVGDGNVLVIGTTRRGLGAKIQAAGPAFGFANDSAAVESTDAKKNNVPDLNAVGAAELDAVLRAGTTGARAGLREGRVEIITEQADDKATLIAGTGSANLALGLTPGQAGAG